MSKYYTVTQFKGFCGERERLPSEIVSLYESWRNQRNEWLSEKTELHKYLFATDTSHTSSGTTPWKNKTTIPKICQIRDNIHANYEAALFPNDEWLKWEGYSSDSVIREKKDIIQAYISNKAREGGFRQTLRQLLLDYIDYGIAIADVIWVNESKEDPDTQEKIPGYVGPKVVRISPLDIVFDPTAIDFRQSTKITRSLVRIGELHKMVEEGGNAWSEEALKWAQDLRTATAQTRAIDVDKFTQFAVDGFGNASEYLGSGYVELLEAEGSFYDPTTGIMYDDYIITIMDRCKVVRMEPIPVWKRGGLKVMTTWRQRPDNLYGMGPLDNLVGMQYRLDHLENAKADAWDLVVTPMFKVKGNVEEFEWVPGGTVHMDESGDVEPLALPTAALSVNNEIQFLMMCMEEFAGAPKQAMGIRTPGEKTAFEVQALENAAGRIFQQKITQFEVDLVEPLLNNMLMLAVKNMGQSTDVIRVLDDDYGVTQFTSITKEDITANGKLRPIGARHFASRAQLIQNLTGITNSALWQKVGKHFSDYALAKMLEDSLQLNRFELVEKNIAISEEQETQRLVQTAQEELAIEQATPVEGDAMEVPVA